MSDVDIVNEVVLHIESSEEEEAPISESTLTSVVLTLESIVNLQRCLEENDVRIEDLVQTLNRLQTFATLSKIRKPKQKNL